MAALFLSAAFPLSAAAVDTLPTGTGGIDTSLFPNGSNPQNLQPVGSNISNSAAANNPQVQGFANGTTGSGGSSGSASGAAADAVGCSAGAMLGQAISMGISNLTSSLADQAVSTMTDVPVADSDVRTQTGIQTSVSSIQHYKGVPYGGSFDSIGFCVVNAIITYVADATIAWANSGFNGNPAFIENPEEFFRGMADREAGKFIKDLVYEATGGGINVCRPFRVQIGVALSETYSKRNNFNSSCSIEQIGRNFEQFAKGNGVKYYWTNWNAARRPENNRWGVWVAANDHLYAQLSLKENTAKFELGLNNGWLSYKKCTDPADQNNPNGKSCKTYTPGSIIQSSLEDTLKIPKDRLVMATKFDQVISAVVNALIKVALNKVLESN